MKKLYLIASLLLLSVFCFSQSRYISATTKKIVFARDGGICKCCGSDQNLEYDHIMPFSCGGKSDAANIQLLCRQCNRSKSNSCYCKVHNNQVGYNCCNGSTTTKSRQYSPSTSGSKATASSQCTGTTKKGARCRKMTTSPSGRCYLH